MDMAQVQRSQLALSVIARALNDPHGWTIGCEGVCVEAQVITSEIGVTFWAPFPALGGEPSVERRAVVAHRGEALWIVAVTPPESGGFEVEVTLHTSTETVTA